MSHFAVLVIGKDIEKQLAPFDENISKPPYARGEVTDEEKQTFIDHYFKEMKGKTINHSRKVTGIVIDDTMGTLENRNGIIHTSFEALYQKYGKDWNGKDSWRKAPDGKWYEWSTCNPNSKWDWYEIGGRWAGWLQLKEGEEPLADVNFSWGWDNQDKQEVLAARKVDQALKGQVDFERMIKDAAGDAGSQWDVVNKIVGHLPMDEKWEDLIAEVKRGDGRFKNVDEARVFYNDQPRQVAFREYESPDKPKFGFWDSLSDLFIPRDEYVENAGLNAVIPYAVLVNGEWQAPSEMGWFGRSHNEKESQLSFNRRMWKLIQALPEDEMLTIVDCHI